MTGPAPVIEHRSGWRVLRLGTVTSTMDVAAGLIAAGRGDLPVAVVADHQTAGRGRAGRQWRSTPGAALQMTAVVPVDRPLGELGVAPLIVGVLVAEAVEGLGSGPPVRLKWPNDVLIGDRKLAGILTVARSDGPDATLLQIGIGINLRDPDDADGRGVGLGHLLTATAPDHDALALRERLLDGVLARLAALPAALDGGAALDRWRARATLIGEPVAVVDAGRTQRGILLGVDERGALLLRADDGTVVTVVAGDLTRGPRASPTEEIVRTV